MADFFAEVDKEMGGVDVLVNNAGIAGPTANVEDVTPEGLAETLDINVAGQFYAAKHVTPGMKARRKGCIINLSSIAGRLAFAMRSPYAASKWAVVGFTKSLAAELGEFDITVNAILPGHVRTERFSRVVAAKARAVGVPEDEMRRALSRAGLAQAQCRDGGHRQHGAVSGLAVRPQHHRPGAQRVRRRADDAVVAVTACGMRYLSPSP